MKHYKCCVLLWCYVHLLKFSYSARILGICNYEIVSHFHFHEVMMRSLATAGHHITMISPYELPYPHENITTINSKSKDLENDDSPMKSFARANLSVLQAAMANFEMFEQDCRKIISLIQRKNLKNFDVMFVELMPMNQCFVQLAKEMGIPVIGTLSFRSFVHVDMAVGHIRNPAVVPSELFFTNAKMPFYERLLNLINEFALIRTAVFIEQMKLGNLCEDLFPGKCSGRTDIALVFLNNHASLQLTALAPNVVNVGGINVKSAKLSSLSEQFEQFIDGAKHGVILFSLGSLASSDAADPHLTSILKNTFAKIPQRVIWKYTGQMRGVSDNVLLSPWVPQKEILAHKNVVAFISHCGLSSTYEAIYFSKPMILLPIFADQPSNAALLDYLGVGLYLNVQELTEENLLETIKEVISNQTYHLNMEKLSRRFKDEPKSPKELVVQWTEYVLRHKGATFMKSVTADLAWYQYLLLDVLAFIIIVSVFMVVCINLFVKCIIYLANRFLKKGIILNGEKQKTK